jgi:hypothetical protein
MGLRRSWLGAGVSANSVLAVCRDFAVLRHAHNTCKLVSMPSEGAGRLESSFFPSSACSLDALSHQRTCVPYWLGERHVGHLARTVLARGF